MLRPLDNHVLQKVAETGFDGALVAGFDLEAVGDGAMRSHRVVGLRKDGSRGVPESGAGGFQFFE